jgi:hypothetical protein
MAEISTLELHYLIAGIQLQRSMNRGRHPRLTEQEEKELRQLHLKLRTLPKSSSFILTPGGPIER